MRCWCGSPGRWHRWRRLEGVSSVAVRLPAGRTRLSQANTVDALAAFAEASRP